MPMKKFCITFLVLIIIIATAVYFGTRGENPAAYDTGYLRIHVRANSNGDVDQAVKYKVKDEVVKFLTPYAAKCVDKDTAEEVIGGILPEIESVCDRVLRENGFRYTSRAKLCSEEFPTRVYGDLTLEAGVYDALIIELGEGTGDNWWCVIYPPLCFTSGSADVRYRSIIYDIIHKFFN